MAGKPARAVDKQVEVDWKPLPGFVEVAPNVWQPSTYVATPYELSAPPIRSVLEVEAEYARCAGSLKYFAFHHLWSLHADDPSGRPQYRKFPAYPYLAYFFDEVQVPCNVHVEKSRQMTMSIAWCAVFLWDVLFHDNWANICVSRREELVDDGGSNATTNSLFGKILSLWRSLPPYLRHPLFARKNLILSPETNSHIHGHTGTPATGRGSTYNRALMDECAHLEHANALFASLKEAAKTGLALNDVPDGSDNLFARIKADPKAGFKYITLHWSQHPEKSKGLYCQCERWRVDPEDPRPPRAQFDEHVRLAKAIEPINSRIVHHARSPWYDKATRGYLPEQVASEFDINYSMSRRGRVFDQFLAEYHTFKHQAVVSEKRQSETSEQYRRRYLKSILQPDKQCVVGWDFGIDDPTSLVLGQVIDEETMFIRWIDEFEERGKSWEFFHDFITTFWRPAVKSATGLDLLHYGDPAGKQRDSDLHSWVKNLKNREPRIVVIHEPHVANLLSWVDFVHIRIQKGHFEVSTYCANLIDHLEQYHYPTDANGDPIPGKQLPVHDHHSHAMSAMRYVYQFRWPNRLVGDGVRPTNSEILTAGNDTPNIGARSPEQMSLNRRLKYF